jgi:hypothetical protein
MAITIYEDRIEFDNHTITFTSTGIKYNGEIKAPEYNINALPNAQGEISGYVTGGAGPTGDVIEKYSFVTSGNSTDVGDLTGSGYGNAYGQSSSTHGYHTGGTYSINDTRKFSFATDGNATLVEDVMSAGRELGVGHSGSIAAYSAGGFNPSAPGGVNIIDKFPLATESPASDVGDLTELKYSVSGTVSPTHGYVTGGFRASFPTSRLVTIERYPFAVDGNASDVGDLPQKRNSAAGTNSETHGYSAGGFSQNPSPVSAPTTIVASIEKYPFASNGNSTSVGSLSISKTGTGQSSTTHGYSAGGNNFNPIQSPVLNNVIDRFPFASDGTASDYGDLTRNCFGAMGSQHY